MNKAAIPPAESVSRRGGATANIPRPTAGCLFSGMGGFASGLIRAGFAIRWASDNDEFACAAFRHRLAEVPLVEKDVRKLSVQSDGLSYVDVLAAGFPCQSFSQAGSRLGFEDERGKLFFEIPRIINEFKQADRPRLLILENVPHLLYGAKRLWFDQVRRSLRRAGYWFREDSCWTVNVKDATELPQDRERLFMVAALRTHFRYNPFSPSSPGIAGKNECRPLDDFLERARQAAEDEYLCEDNRYYKMINREMERGESSNNIYQLRRSYVREKKQGLCPTLTANMGIGGHNVPFIRDQWGVRRLSVVEVARLQGFDTQELLFPDMPTAEQYRLLGNAVCVQLAHLVGLACADILNGGTTR